MVHSADVNVQAAKYCISILPSPSLSLSLSLSFSRSLLVFPILVITHYHSYYVSLILQWQRDLQHEWWDLFRRFSMTSLPAIEYIIYVIPSTSSLSDNDTDCAITSDIILGTRWSHSFSLDNAISRISDCKERREKACAQPRTAG